MASVGVSGGEKARSCAGVSSPIPLVEAPGTRFGSRHRTVAKAETTGYAPAFRRACDWLQRCRWR